jgi:ferredoxin
LAVARPTKAGSAAERPAAGPEATEDFLVQPEYAQVSRQVRPALPRYRNEIGKFRVHRSSNCIQCGRCVERCPYGVHTRPAGYRQIVRPLDYRCIGPDCAKTDHYCVSTCPQGALSITTNPAFETLGDYRWTADLIVSTWQMAETGRGPSPNLECEIGASGGGFDRIRFRFPPTTPEHAKRQAADDLRPEDISTELLLNRRNDSRKKLKIDVVVPVPDSARDAAIEIARKLNLRYREALV